MIARQEQSEALPSLLPKEFTNAMIESKEIIIIAGSTWGVDEELLASSDVGAVRIVIVPHEISEGHIGKIQKLFPDSIRLSKIDRFQNEYVIIVDTIGKLFQLYKYADIAYVGGGFGAGVHNTLEAAVWGKPVICGPRHKRSKEISELVSHGGGFIVQNSEEFEAVFNKLHINADFRKTSGLNANEYVSKERGSVELIAKAIEAFL